MKLNYKITGIDCPNCAAKLERKLEKIDGVRVAALNFLTSKLMIEGEEEKESEIVAAVEKLVSKTEPDAVLQKL